MTTAQYRVRCLPDPGVTDAIEALHFLLLDTIFIAKCNSQKVSFTRDGESVRRREWCRIHSFEFAH